MKQQNEALTLLELLIAVSILVVVMVTIYTAFRSGIFGYRDIAHTLDVHQSVRSILNRIDLDLRNSFVYKDDDAKFNGSEKTISFLALVDTFKEDSFAQDFAFIAYELNGNKIVRLCRKNQEALKEKSEILPEEIADSVGIKFTYGYIPKGKQGQEQELEFKESWGNEEDERRTLPLAVRVELTIEGALKQKFLRTVYLPLAQK
jgi:hypothetical protein